MSANNAAAQIGSATPATSKIPSIGAYVQDTTAPGPGSDGPYFGVQGLTVWGGNWLGEDPGFIAPSTAGTLGITNVPAVGVTPPDVGNPAPGKKAQWTTSGGAPITVPADGRLTVTAGTAVAASGTGLYKTFLAPASIIPAGSFFWSFEF
jgi:hypothetical protein